MQGPCLDWGTDLMADQAYNLRSLMKNKEAQENKELQLSARVITVTSGKGGVGKSNFTLNLGLYMKSLGKRVIIIDADFGLANIEVLMGAMPKYTLLDVIKGNCGIIEALAEGPEGIKFISGGSGLSQLADMDESQVASLIESLSLLDSLADIILIDTGAGISKQVINFILASKETIIVTTPEPTSITDAYAIIKTMKEKERSLPEINILVNRTDGIKEGTEVYSKLERVCRQFLSIDVKYLGYLPNDPYLVKAVKTQVPVSIAYPASPVARRIAKISDDLLSKSRSIEEEDRGVKGFIKNFIRKLKQ